MAFTRVKGPSLGNVTAESMTITGNLVVLGTQISLDTENILISDSIVTLNANVTGSPILDSGLEINRGTSANVFLVWDESDDAWQVSSDGTTFSNIVTVATTSKLLSANGSANGIVDTTTQTFAGNKTFTNNVTVNGTITGNVTGTTSNATNLNNQPASYYTNASNLNSGTIPLDRLASASITANGVVDTTTQSFAGNKTFTNNVSVSGTITGNVTGTASNATNLNSQPASYYTNASNLNSGTLAIARLDANVILTTSTTGINASALSVGTVPDGRLTGTYTTITANNATNFGGQPASYYTNASNLSTGTLAIPRLDANVILTSSSTGINASALSVGTVPLARLTSASSSANGIVDTTTQTFAGNKTFANNVSITGNLNVLGTTTTVSANNLIVDDSLIQLAANNTTSDLLDIGLYGNYNADGGSHEHTGFFRDTTDDTWKLFKGLQDAPTTTINTIGIGYTIATLQSYLSSGALTTNSSALAITANSTYSVNMTANAVTATTFTGNLTGTVSNATNLNSQPGSYYTNASNLATGTVPIARLDANVILTTSTTGINASALSTGTVPIARLDANVILTTSTTGINASALSTGTVPAGRLPSATTSANGAIDTTTQSFAGNKTFTGTLNATSTLGISGAVNALSTLGVTSNAIIDSVRVGSWTGGSTYKGIHYTSMVNSEYMIMSRGDDTFISAVTGNSVRIRGGNNISTFEIAVSGSARPTVGGNIILDAGNYNSYAPTLTGTGASGSWGINITGTAPAGTLTGSTLASGVTASSLTSVGTLTNLTVTNTITGSVSGNADTVDSLHAASFSRKDTTSQWIKPYYEYGNYLTSESPATLASQMSSGGGLRVDFMHPSYTGSGGWNHVITFSGYNFYNMYQIGGHYDGSTGTDLWVRSEASHAGTSWTAWRKLLNSSNYNSYAMAGAGYSANQNLNTSSNVTFADVSGTRFYSSNWFRNTGATGLYNETYGRGIRECQGAGATYGNMTTYGTGHNGWDGWAIGTDMFFMGRPSVRDWGIYDNTRGWAIYQNPSSHGGVSIGGSSPLSGYALRVEGSLYVNSNIYAGGGTITGNITGTAGNLSGNWTLAGSGGILSPGAAYWVLYYDNSVTRMGIGSSYTQAGYTVTINGSQYVTSSLAVAGSKSFEIPHPVVLNKRLRYAAVESPRVDLIHRGTAVITNGETRVNLDTYVGLTSGTLEALMRDMQCFVTNISAIPCHVYAYLDGIELVLRAVNETEAIPVNWLVIGERQDSSILADASTDENGRLINEVTVVD